MTAIFARQPLRQLSMSSSQRAPRRLSARLEQKEDVHRASNGFYSTNDRMTIAQKSSNESGPLSKKRKIDYDEEDDGFLFTRAKTRKVRSVASKAAPISTSPAAEHKPTAKDEVEPPDKAGDASERAKKKRNKMSFSTPNVKDEKLLRRSKRLSHEHDHKEGNHQDNIQREETVDLASAITRLKQAANPPSVCEKTPALASDTVAGEEHSATRIALPFADTPVIRRNKAMREGKAGKGERRSSLGLRGRRASSLIDSGSSNALPHHEVDAANFYKHIESEGLPEPRRMRQLLTWCATRAMGEKPTGTEFEDQSARMSARVIEEELLKDLANRSEMSDWFNREEAPKTTAPLVTRPNPKNIQNAAKVEELEQQIKRLQSERQSLEALLRPPLIRPLADDFDAPAVPLSADLTVLLPPDVQILESLASTPISSAIISARLNALTASLGPTIDAFAGGIHQIAQYRDAANRVAGQVLGMCADRLRDRDEGDRRHALGESAELTKHRDELGGVLRSLSRLER